MEQKISVKIKNTKTNEWDVFYPKTLAEVVITKNGENLESHVSDKALHVTGSEKSDWGSKATKEYVDLKISQLADSSPAALDTLKELSDALNNDPDYATTIATALSKKIDKASIDSNPNLGISNLKVPSQKAVKNYVDNQMQSAGNGDMLKTAYDKNNNGKVDVAEFAESCSVKVSAESNPPIAKPGEIWFAVL